MNTLKALVYTLPLTLILSSFVTSANALLFDIEKFNSEEIVMPQKVTKSSRVELLWSFWKDNNALLTLFKFKKPDVFMTRLPVFLPPPSEQFISKISYEAVWPIGEFSFLIKKKSENEKCENSQYTGKVLEMIVSPDSSDKVKNVANSFIVKLCPKETAKGISVNTNISLDSKGSEKPDLSSWFSLETKAINGILKEIKESMEKKLPDNFPTFLSGTLKGVNDQPVLSVNIDEIMKANCRACSADQSANDSLKNVPETSTNSNSRDNLTTLGK